MKTLSIFVACGIAASACYLFYSLETASGETDPNSSLEVLPNQVVENPIEWLHAGKSLTVIGRGESQRVQLTTQGEEPDHSFVRIRPEAPLASNEIAQTKTVARQWAADSQRELMDHLDSYDDQSVLDIREWGEIDLDLALLESAGDAIDAGRYFVEGGQNVHDLHGLHVIRVPIQRDGNRIGVHVAFAEGDSDRVDRAVEFLKHQHATARGLAAYRFNGLPLKDREQLIAKRNAILRENKQERSDRLFLAKTFPCSVGIDSSRAMLVP